MKSPDAKEFAESFLNHPNPIIYSHCPEIPELCQAVIPESNGTFSDKSLKMGLGSFLLGVKEIGIRDLKSLWHSWDQNGLWNHTTRQNLADALDKPITFFFDGVFREDPNPFGDEIDILARKDIPRELLDPRFVKFDVRKVPFIPWLRGPIWNFFIPQDSMIVGYLMVPVKPTRMWLAELGLEYAAA